jgi:hypothetical protein
MTQTSFMDKAVPAFAMNSSRPDVHLVIGDVQELLALAPALRRG